MEFFLPGEQDGYGERRVYKLDIGPLASAVDRLREGYERHRSEPADEQLRVA